jgi:hypothetical protein
MPRIAWAKNIMNAYNAVKKGDVVYDTGGNLLGVSDGIFGRATATSDGSVHLTTDKWISGKVEKENDHWIIQSECKVS